MGRPRKYERNFTKLGDPLHPVYQALIHLRYRCRNESFKQYMDYGGRGITVCEEWDNDPETFVDWSVDFGGWEAGKGLTIERINNNGNYEPDNCEWIIRELQSANQRIRKDNTSGMRGINWNKKLKKWIASIHSRKVSYYLGCYRDIDEANEARNKFIDDHNLPHQKN